MIRPTRYTQRWGRVSAKPSEYLIKIRKGKVVRHGPGLSVFLWPSDTCTILPTSIQRTTFTADQITAEKVGVAVTGIAVYRIADPLLAFRMLDFSSGAESIEDLSEILRDMFIGAARRLVANMTVNECLTRRKESIAVELMREIQPVVSGLGRCDDATDQGWGLVIDTIEIQDVRILSEKVFADLQTPYRADLELQSKRSQVERDQQVHLREVEAKQKMLTVDQDLARQRSEAAERTRLEELAQAERVRGVEIEGQSRMAERQLEADLIGRQRARQLADADAALQEHQAAQQAELAQQQARHESELERQQAEAGFLLEEARATAAGRVARQQMEIERLRGELSALLSRQAREVENLLPEERVRYDFVVTTLPAIAQAFAKSFGPVHLTQIGSGGDGGKGLGFLAEALAEVLAVGRSAGLDLGALCRSAPSSPSAPPSSTPAAQD
jgi:flotillin